MVEVRSDISGKRDISSKKIAAQNVKSVFPKFWTALQ